MQNARTVSLFVAVFFWANIAGAISYAHTAFFPSYLGNLPESVLLVKEGFGIRDERFWMSIHPLAIIATVVTLLLNWKIPALRKWIVASALLYCCVIAVTAVYFVPELLAFAKSDSTAGIAASEWKSRGQKWQYLSWIRGLFMYAGFAFLLVALWNSKKYERSENKSV